MPGSRIQPASDFFAASDGSGISATDAAVFRHSIADYRSGSTATVDLLRGLKASQVVRLFGDAFKTQIGAGNDSGTFPATATAAGTITITAKTANPYTPSGADFTFPFPSGIAAKID